MAKQTGDIIIVGTIDDITFYKMEGKGYARKKSSLTGKRVKRDPRFKRTMQSAGRFGKGNQLASRVYRSLPREKQVYALFKELKRTAILAIKEGKGEAEVLILLQQRVKKNQKVKKLGIVIEQSQVRNKLCQLKKSARLIRLYGGSAKKSGRGHTERQRRQLRHSTYHRSTAQQDYRQRE